MKIPKPVVLVYDSLRQLGVNYRGSNVRQWNRLVNAIKREIAKETEKVGE